MSKYGITLELTHEAGRKVFEQLVSISDVVVENFRQGTLERLGYTYEVLKKLRPDLIYVSMPAFGNSGPWQGYVAYGIGQEQLCGMAHMTGYRDEGPMKSGINHGDPITGSHAAGVVLAALRYRKRTGQGMFVDVSQQESAVSLIGGEVLAYQMTGQEPERMGDRSPYFAPHNVYPCAGEDRWVTIAATSDEEWASLATAIGHSELVDDPLFATLESRLQNQGKLDDIISAWTCSREMYQIAQGLQGQGIPAGPVLRGPDLLQDPHYRARHTFNEVTHSQVGPKWYPGFAWRMSETPGQVHWPSPTLGQHNHQIYSQLLGLTDQEISELEETGVIGTKPTGSRII
jgi:crotonobetainyl-CoA:carnitine CoA-transferase CaiB-like acyl-CoA transferase